VWWWWGGGERTRGSIKHEGEPEERDFDGNLGVNRRG